MGAERFAPRRVLTRGRAGLRRTARQAAGRLSGLLRRLASGLPWAALAPLCAAQPVDPRTQYAEWPVLSDTLQCESLAVSPEVDAGVRRHEVAGVTRLFAVVAADQHLRIVGPASDSPMQGLYGAVVQRLALERLQKCRATGGPVELLLEVHWNFTAGPPVRITTRPGSPREVRQPVMLADQCEKPAYPPDAARLGEQGTTRLLFVVDETGSVQRSRVWGSSGHARLDQAAQLALSRCPFTPATLHGEPLGGSVPVMLEYVWKLQ